MSLVQALGVSAGTSLPLVLLVLAIRRPSSVSLTLGGEDLRIDFDVWDRTLSVCRGLSIPVRCVKGVAVAPRHLVPHRGFRIGTSFPGIRAGSFGFPPKRDFWLVRRAEQLLVVELTPGEPYRHIVLETHDPCADALRLRPVVGAYTGRFTQ